MAKSPEEMVKDMMANLLKTTGKSLEEWKSIVSASGLTKHGEVVKFLKETHGIGHGYANMITHEAQQSHSGALAAQDVDLEASWFAGKEGMRPVYDRLMQIATGLGADIEQSPKKAYMSLRRNKQFCCIGPFTKAKTDLQIQLKSSAPADDRIKEVKGGMTSHVVKIGSLDEIDSDVIAWIKIAYDAC